MASYEQVKDIPNHPEQYLFDVRDKDEVEATGLIPTAINIPLTELEAALNQTPADFENKYGRAKPDKNAKIFFSCKAGGRAQRATNAAKELGYTNTVAYYGSWTNWAHREGLDK